VRVALAGRSVAEEGEGDDGIVAELGGHGQPGRVQRLRGQRCGQRCHPMLVGVEAAVPAALEQREDLDDVDAAGEDADGVAVGGEEPVVLLERDGGTDLGGLLAEAGGVDAERALAGEVDRLAVDAAAERHEAVEISQLRGVELEFVAAGFSKAAVGSDVTPNRGPTFA